MGLTADLPLLFNDETYSDLKVHYQGTGDCSHRCIVLPKSKKLRDMCTREKDDLKGVPQYEIDMSSEAAGYAPVGAMLKSMYMSDETQIFEGCTFGECVATFDLAERFGLSDLKEAARRASGPAGENLPLGAQVGDSMDIIRHLKSAGVSALVDQFLLKRMPEFLAEKHSVSLQWLEGSDKIRWLDMLELRRTADSTAISNEEDSVFEASPNDSCVTKAARAMVNAESRLQETIVRPTAKKRKRMAENSTIGVPSSSSPADGRSFLDGSASV